MSALQSRGGSFAGSGHPEIAQTNPIFTYSSCAFAGSSTPRGRPGVDLSKTNPILPGSGRRVGVRSSIKRFAFAIRAQGGRLNFMKSNGVERSMSGRRISRVRGDRPGAARGSPRPS